jgi:SAM-dependent methyltransferase
MDQISHDKKKIGNYWDNIAKGLGDFSQAPSTLFYREREIDTLKKWLKSFKKIKFLSLDLWDEVHNTRIMSWVMDRGGVGYGIDISEYQVGEIRTKFKKIAKNFIQSDVREIKFPSNFFDVVFGLGTIEHMPDYGRAIAEIFRVTKPGGIAVVGVPNKADPFLRPLMVTISSWFGWYPYAPEKSFWWNEFRNLFWSAGFEIVEETGFVVMPGWLRALDMWFQLHAPSLTKITGLMLKPFMNAERNNPGIRRHGYIIACVLRKPKKRA